MADLPAADEAASPHEEAEKDEGGNDAASDVDTLGEPHVDEVAAAVGRDSGDEDGEAEAAVLHPLRTSGGSQKSLNATRIVSMRREQQMAVQKEAAQARAAQLRLKGKQALASHNFSQALKVLTEAINLCSDSWKLHRLRSVALSCLQQYELALADAEIVISLAPTIADGHYHKGYALYHMRAFSDAAKAFQEGMRLNPQDRMLRQGFWDAVTLLSQQPGEKAEDQLQELGIQDTSAIPEDRTRSADKSPPKVPRLPLS